MFSLQKQLQSLPSVAGIVHSAMVLRDEYIKDWKFESFTEVMGPKIKGDYRHYFISQTLIFPLTSFVYLIDPKKIELYLSTLINIK